MAKWNQPIEEILARIEQLPKLQPILDGDCKGIPTHSDDMERISGPSVVWGLMREAGIAESPEAQIFED